MTDHDDYLWDHTGNVDPSVRDLERALAALAHDGRELSFDPPTATAAPTQPSSQPRRRWPWLLVAAAVLLVPLPWIIAVWRPEPSLAPGAKPRQFVATGVPLHLELGNLANLTLAPGTQLQFEHWRKDQALFRLVQGTLTARVAPPPAVAAGFFQVDTSLGRVVDQGCSYELTVASDGTAHVRVTEGAVTFEFPQRTVFVPAGAATSVTARGPRTPLFLACSAGLRQAVRYFDDVTAKGAIDLRGKAVQTVLQNCQEPRDSLVLWHLLRDADPELRTLAEQALVEQIGPPPGASKAQHWEPDEWLTHLRAGAWTQAK